MDRPRTTRASAAARVVSASPVAPRRAADYPGGMTRWLLLPLLAFAGPASAVPQATSAPAPAARPSPAPVPLIVPTVVARYPHDPAAFTEGLIWHDGALFESVGMEGQSDVRRVDLRTGKPLRRAAIPIAQFGEGLAAWKDQLVSLTWHDGIAHRWAARTLKPLGTSRYTGEGWGLTSDGTALIRSDGSPTLIFHDPATLAERRRVTVTLNGRAVRDVNELEWVDGAILANVWHTPFILRIDPASGRATAVIDLRAIVAEVGATDREAVANGIAWDAQKRRLFVTGKRWPTLYEIALPPQR
jgi:glutamine cyclotransferase